MAFPTGTFAVFFLVVLAATWAAAPRPVLRKVLLVAAGGAFYAYLDARYVALLAGMVLVNWGAGRLVAAGERRRTAPVLLGVMADLAALGVFKYEAFFVDSAIGALARLGIHVPAPAFEVLLPVGISFYTFEAISYLVDVRRGRLDPQPLLDVATWLCFFPTLLSGPITRAGELIPQLRGRPDGAHLEVDRAFWLIGRGLVKKLVVASFLASAITDHLFADPAGFGAVGALVGVYAYAAQIYTDFSGYTDMAIGLALLLGVRLPENFDRPYTAVSVQDFWSRWHMTLTRWIRDYLFAPVLGGARAGARTYAGIVAVMLVVGLWHGAGWTFVAFGGVHGVAMAAERWSRQHRRAKGRPPVARTWRRQAVRRLATFHVVCLGWIFFGSGSLGLAGTLLRVLATRWERPVTGVTPLLLLVVVAVLAAQYVPAGLCRRAVQLVGSAPRIVQVGGLAASLVVVLSLAPTTVPAFIYFRF